MDASTVRSAGVCLVADDDEFFRLALRSILTSKMGFSQVIETGSLDEAVERLAEAKEVDLALFDLAMPGMASAASLRAVRECFPELKVAVVSASSRRSDILLALQAGAHGYVPKSLGPHAIINALEVIETGGLFVPPTLADISDEREAPAMPARVKAGQPAGAADQNLTPRQHDVLQLVVQGFSNKEIARRLGLGEGTVKVHVAALFRTLGVTSRSAAAAVGARVLQTPRD